MNEALLYALIVITVSRLIFQWHEKPLGTKAILIKGLGELVLLAPLFSWQGAGFWGLFILLLNGFSWWTEQRTKAIELVRLGVYVGAVVLLLVTDGHTVGVTDAFNPIGQNIWYLITGKGILAKVASPYFLGILWGMLALTNEANHLLRYALQRLEIEPQKKEKTDHRLVERKDLGEMNRGRVIGVLERWLIFLIALNGPLNAIGFILAAKGLARFKELDDRRFAEYLIIGTLMSSLMALMLGLLLKVILRP